MAERLAQWDGRLVVPVDRLEAVLDWLVGVVRETSLTAFGSPGADALRISLVTGQPWTGYNWYDGGLRSRFDLNIDLPVRAPELIGLVAHETYPGHHLEHAWHEALRVDERAELEASVLLINAPECLISEGLAEVGRRFAVPAANEPDVLAELFDRVGSERRPRCAGGRLAGRAGHPDPRGTDGPRCCGNQCRPDAPRRRRRSGQPSSAGSNGSQRCPPSEQPDCSSSSSTRCGGRTSSSTARGPPCSTVGWLRSRSTSDQTGSDGCWSNRSLHRASPARSASGPRLDFES